MLISVIIPCYNVEQYVAECIDSVINQSYPNIEIICINNNSSDSTFKILKDYESQFPSRIKVLEEFKPGAPAARNKGFAIAKGQWIQFLDADDILISEKLEHQIKILNEKKNTSFIVAEYFKRTREGNQIKQNLRRDDVFKGLFLSDLGITSSNLFNSKILKEVGGWNEELKSSQEADLMFRILKTGVIPEYDLMPLTIVRERLSGQISQRNPKEKWLGYIKLRIQIIQFLKKEKSDYFKKEKDFYSQNLFSQIRVLAEYDVELANNILVNNFDAQFLSGNQLPFSSYKVLFKMLGFKKTEKFKKLLKRIIS